MNSVSQDEIEEVVHYAGTYLPLATESYRQIWYKLHISPNSVRWPNILLLCELVFSLPFTTCRVEQMFSLLRVVKIKCRTNLQTSTLHESALKVLLCLNLMLMLPLNCGGVTALVGAE